MSSNKNEAPQSEEIRVANELLHVGDYRAAYDVFLRHSRTGSAYASFNLGWMHHTGSGVEKNFDKAKQYYQNAIDQGSVMACHYLGMLNRAMGNNNDAIKQFEIAARDGYLPSIYWSGTMYLHGEGVTKDFVKAENYLRIAAEKGHVYAKRDLALSLLNGRFGRRKIIKGVIEWIKSIYFAIVLGYRDPNNERLQ